MSAVWLADSSSSPVMLTCTHSALSGHWLPWGPAAAERGPHTCKVWAAAVGQRACARQAASVECAAGAFPGERLPGGGSPVQPAPVPCAAAPAQTGATSPQRCSLGLGQCINATGCSDGLVQMALAVCHQVSHSSWPAALCALPRQSVPDSRAILMPAILTWALANAAIRQPLLCTWRRRVHTLCAQRLS